MFFSGKSQASFSSWNWQDTLKKTFKKEEIEKIADAYINNNIAKKNPVFFKSEKDSVFDMIVFNKSVEYYKNTGTLENPFFVSEKFYYSKFTAKLISKISEKDISDPSFIVKWSNKIDIFSVSKMDFNVKTGKYDYQILYSEKSIDDETIVTIIAAVFTVLFFVVLVLAIASH